jgi:protein ImuB
VDPVRTLAVHCFDWPVVAAGLPLDEPAAVLHANRVVATSPAARALAVHRGLRRREAQSRCPGLTVLDHDPVRDARSFEPLVVAVEAVTPRVEVTRPGRCAFPTRGPSRYFGGDNALARRVADLAAAALDGRGEAQVGVADSPFAAALAARSPQVTVVPPAGTGDFLAPFPVAALDRPELADVLVRLGLPTLGAVAALPRADLVARFGREGERAHRLATGSDDRPPATRRPPPDLAVRVELDPPAERVDQAAFAAKRLADDLHADLERRGLACTRVAVVAETEHGERRERLWRHEGALSAAAIADRVRWQLDGWLHGGPAVRPTCGIAVLALVPDEVVPATGRQLGFWGGQTEAAERATRALARVQGMLGAGSVTVPEPAGGRHPEDLVDLVPAETVDLARRGSAGDRAARPWPGRLPEPSPAVVLTERVPVEVVDQAGVPVGVSGRGLVTAAPARLSRDGAPWVVVDAWAGPWPVDERWWDAAAHRRRARFQVLAEDGRAHLLVIEGGRWWLEATYD